MQLETQKTPTNPTLVFTTFWDANKLIEKGLNNYNVYSIALKNPELDKLPYLANITRLDFFCPTYDILMKYKNDNNWEEYTKSYIALMKNRKNETNNWIKSLKDSNILCCWENTSKNANCHRKIIYNAFQKLKNVKTIYRHGNETNYEL